MILLYEMGKNNGIGTLDTVGRQHTDEQQIYSICLMPLEHLQQMPPSPRQKLAVACLLQGSGKRGEGNAKAYQLSTQLIYLFLRNTLLVISCCHTAVNHANHQIEVSHLDVLVYQLVDLLLRQLLEVVQVGISLVQYLEDAMQQTSLRAR